MAISHGFELVREQNIPEINSHARLWRHVATGAELLSLENDDENKSFAITFRTRPSDSTGVAHILEHSVLGGSRKYPLRDPFVQLARGSLQTFVNAMTYPDKTVYLFASQNLQDFYNLIEVYLDATLYPLLREETYHQQAWHHELEHAEDQLNYRGVVFNEMKGAYSSPDALLSRTSTRTLFPDTTYGVDSGGDPKHIPDLTHEQLVNFHRTYYHPSNARIFFYGDDDPDERLRITDEWLKDFSRLSIDSEISLQPRFVEPRFITQKYAVGQNEASGKKSYLAVNWMLDEISDPTMLLALAILSEALLGTPVAPLRKALLESGLGEDVVGGGFYAGLRQPVFQTGLKGIAAEAAHKVEALILDTLARLDREGIDQATIDAALNTVEFDLREKNTGNFPRGLMMMLESMQTWLYGGDPLAMLAFEAPLAAVIQNLAADPAYLSGLIKPALLDNPHRVTVLLEPDPELAQQEATDERSRLDQTHAALSPEDVEAIIATTRKLKAMQEQPEAPELVERIPSLTLADLPEQNKTIPLEMVDKAATPILYHNLFTNGIVYLDLGFDLHQLPQDLLPYIPLFGRALIELGTEKEGPVEIVQHIGRATGGIQPVTLATAKVESPASAAWLFLRGKATTERASELLAILRDILLSAKLDNHDRFRQMVLEEKAGREARLVPAGSAVATGRLRAHYGEAGWANDQMSGVGSLLFIRELAQRVESDWEQVLATLERIRGILVNQKGMVANVTLDADNWRQFEPQLQSFLGEMPDTARQAGGWSLPQLQGNEGLTIPAKVNYVAKGADLFRLGYQLNGSAEVVAQYLNGSYLWDRVRVQGGAYGGGCIFDNIAGIFSFYSYRDPNLMATLDVYNQTGKYLREADITPTELTRSIIGTIGRIDAYQLPDAKGFTSLLRYLAGNSDERRQQIRTQILATSKADFRAFADVLDQVRESGDVVILGNQGAIESVATEKPGWIKVINLM